MLSEKKKKNLPIGYLILVLQFCFYSCNFQVPKGLEDLGLLLNFQKFTSATAVSEGNITVTGTVKDASGTAISGGILEISRSTSANTLSRATADTKVYADTNGKFSMNIYAGSFSIKVSRSDGTLVGSFALKVTNATSTPEVSSATGLQVTGISAAPVGSGGTTGTTGGTTTTTPVAFLSIPNGTPSSILEGNSSTIGVIMTGSVTQSYTVTITSSNPSAISVSPSSIEVTPTNFSINKQITLTVLQDENLVSENVKITLSSEGLNKLEFTLTTTDDDTQNIVLNGVNSLTQNNSGSITVKLTKEPPSNITVNLVSSLPSALTLSTSSLTFTPTNYSLPQTVTVNALQDTNQESETVTITVSAVGISDSTWNVLCIDEPSIVFTGGSSVTEGSSIALSITLSGNPGVNRTVNFVSGNTSSLTVSPSSMFFTPSSFNASQTLTVTGVEEANASSEAVIITASGTGLVTSTKTVNTVDNDTMNITLSGASTMVDEGSTGTLSVALTQEPASNLTVNLSSSVPTSLSFSTSSLTFTPLNYNTPQTVTLNSLQDSNQDSETVTVTASATGVSNTTWNILCVDDDSTPVFTGGSSVAEGGTMTLSITLSGNPGVNRTVNFVSGKTSSLTVSPSSMVFTPSNYNSTQTLTVTGVEDTNVISEAVLITASGTGIVSSAKTVNTVDNDTMNITLGGATTVLEGSTGTITVALTHEPVSNLTVNLSSSVPTLSLSTSSLTFTPLNYNTPQTVTLNSLQDSNQDSETVTVTASATGVSNTTWNIICVDDDSTPVFTGGSSVTEGGTMTLSITLSGNPGVNRTVNFVSGNTSFLTVFPSSMVFTPSNYTTAQTLTVTGVEDTNVISEAVLITASGTGIVSSTKTVNTVENDTMNITLGGATKVLKGSTTNLSVALTHDPSTNFVVSISSGDSSTISISPSSLTFNSTNYSTAQNFALILPVNGNQTSVVITASASGVTSQTRSIQVIDGNSPTLLVSATPGLLKTGQISTFLSGDDGSYQKGLTKTFTVGGSTGLIWQRCSLGQNYDETCSGNPQQLTWSNANTYCNSLPSLGGNTWRLPTVNELLNLVDYGISSSGVMLINSTAFPNTVWASSYWSSSTSVQNSGHALYVGFTGGSAYSHSKDVLFNLRCVSGSQAQPSFSDNGNGTVTDSSTGLQWQKCSAGQGNITGNCSTGTASSLIWASAITYCQNLTINGISGWRLPNINELRSIVDYTKSSSPLIDSTAFPNTLSTSYWSSTSNSEFFMNAYIIRFDLGWVEWADKSTGSSIRCVR